jgi:hypothetical protein
MTEPVALQLDPLEQHMLTAALALYEALLASAHEVGGDARDTAETMGPIAARVSRRLNDLMYGDADVAWQRAKAELDATISADEWAGDWYVYPAGVGR